MEKLQEGRNVAYHFFARELVVRDANRVPALAGKDGGGREEEQKREEGREGGVGAHCWLCGRV
jgi:hypothetical protein